MSNRKEDFFNEATKQIKDSYVFQHDESYSDDDVRDIAISLAEYGYQYAVEKACKWMEEEAIHGWIEDEEVDKFIGLFRKAMDE